MKQKLRVIRSPFTAVHIHVRILRSNSVRSVLIEFQFARARACVCVCIGSQSRVSQWSVARVLLFSVHFVMLESKLGYTGVWCNLFDLYICTNWSMNFAASHKLSLNSKIIGESYTQWLKFIINKWIQGLHSPDDEGRVLRSTKFLIEIWFFNILMHNPWI